MNPERSSLTVRPEDDPLVWNSTITRLPYYHVLQSCQWGKFKSRHGWFASHLIFEERGLVRAAALVLKRKLPRLPWGIMYVPKGPMLDYGDIELVNGVLAHLERLARQQKALIIKIDPDVSFPDGTPNWMSMQARVTAPASPLPIAPEVIDTLSRRGWRYSNEQVQFRNTLLIDLGQSEDELLARMKSKTRYNIRLAARKGVRVRVGDPSDLLSFYRLYYETSIRDKFLIRPFEYYCDVWQSFLRDDMADLLLAEWEGELLGGLLLFRLGHKALYIYGASSNVKRHLMPNYLLQWEAIRTSKRRGCLLYDLWGAPSALDENDPMWGVYRFKTGLGGEMASHIGAFDFPADPVLSRAYSWLLPRYLSFLRLRHRHGSGSGTLSFQE